MHACIYGAYQGQEASQVVLVVKNPPANAGDIRDPGLQRSSGGRHSNSLQYSCLENPMGRGAWRTMIHRVTKSQTGKKQISTYQGELPFNVPGLFLVYTEYIHADIEQTYVQNGKHRIQSRTEQQVPPQFIYLDLDILYVLRALPLWSLRYEI